MKFFFFTSLLRFVDYRRFFFLGMSAVRVMFSASIRLVLTSSVF